MRELKPGDRVRVEFEATVSNAGHGWTHVQLEPGNQKIVWVKADACTLIEPEIVLPEIPGTIVQVDPLDEHGERDVYMFTTDELCSWISALGEWRGGCELAAICREFGYRVIPAAEADGVSE